MGWQIITYLDIAILDFTYWYRISNYLAPNCSKS